jgi:SagB-type dehydrogenase family enzyme
VIHRYHEATKHHFQQFARSLGYLDWASQPNPFRSFPGAPAVALDPDPDAPAHAAGAIGLIADILRHSLGLSAWKQFRESRWALRVNPSSGNLHPTEAYIVAGPTAGLSDRPAVHHYAPDRHALERRCAFSADAWHSSTDGRADVWLIALTSIHWREAWKYGERAFRYCQHDLGHAIAAVRLAADLAGLRLTLLPEWSHAEIASLIGVDRDADYLEAEREAPACVMAMARGAVPDALRTERARLVDAARAGDWTGHASQLSEDHVEWTIIDDVARATVDPGHPRLPRRSSSDTRSSEGGPRRSSPNTPASEGGYTRALILQRRSAQSFDGQSAIARERFITMLRSVMPGARPPWDALWWTPRMHLALFVHRVAGLDPGLYMLPRDAQALDRLRAACGREFLWEPADDDVPLLCLARGDCRALARRLSCDQDIAADGFFSLGMIADFDESLREYGPSFYRHLFWESGVVGQILYLEAEAADARATGIGCFYDDPVHDVLGLSGHAFQSLYHFTVGVPVEDARISTLPVYLP